MEVTGVNELSYWTIGASDKTLPVETTIITPKEFLMYPNYPNPFNPVTTIRFSIPQAAFVNISVYNSLGERITTLVNEYLSAAFYEKTFNGENLPRGVYICKFTAGDITLSQKMILIK